MKKISLYLLIAILISACSTNPSVVEKNDVTITGTKITKEENKDAEPVMVIKADDFGATTLQDLLNQIANKPFEDGATCAEAIKGIKSKGYNIVSIEKNTVVATVPSNPTVKTMYNFENSDCPQ